MAESVWLNGQKKHEFQTLEGSKKTDVLIIGGGLCGVLCAYFLKNEGMDCLLVEAGHDRQRLQKIQQQRSHLSMD